LAIWQYVTPRFHNNTEHYLEVQDNNEFIKSMKTPKGNAILLPIAGFVLAAILLSSLSSFVIFLPYFSRITDTNSDELFYLGTLVYFIGMPAGKILGRFFRYHRNITLTTTIVIIIVSVSIVLMPFVTSMPIILLLRFVQGSATILMEIFSISFSYVYSERTRILASTFAISGIPTGVTLGSSIPFLASLDPFVAYFIMGILSIVMLVPFIFLLGRNREKMLVLKHEKKGTTMRMPVTWVMGALWMTMTVNLIMATIIPEYLGQYDPKDILGAMGVFGIWAAISTIIGGLASYLLYDRASGYRSLIIVSAAGFAISIPGFILLSMKLVGFSLLLAIFLTQFGAFVVAMIYSIPRKIYPEGYVAKGIWEFSSIGSFGHIAAPLILIPVGYAVGFRFVFIILLLIPIYGILAMIYFFRKV